jgi:hypothetical protein
MPVDMSPREYRARFVDGPFAGREADVVAHQPEPLALYLLPGGGVLSPVEIVRGTPEMHALGRSCWLYVAGPKGTDGVPQYVLVRAPRDTAAHG